MASDEDGMKMTEQPLKKRAKVAIVICILASLGFLIAAVAIFIREGDWPARYISAGVTILAVLVIALRRRTSRRH